MTANSPSPEQNRRPLTARRWLWGGLGVALLAAGGLALLGSEHPAQAQMRGPGGMGKGQMPPQPVTASVARTQDVPVWLTALGTVTPRSYVNVMPRVAGLLQSVDYKQGQTVKAGQLLAQIDPRPFRIAVEQAQAQLEQTQAQLAGAQSDLLRYETLLKQDSISAQQVSDQRATVAQLKATLDANKAALDNAKLQLSWTRITAPVSGLTGLRPVDAGNMVTTSGAVGSNTSSSTNSASPVATIAQVQPVDVTFALPQQQIGEVVSQLMAGKQLQTQSWDARNTQLLETGKLVAADNQINSTTGTLNLRAEFANPKLTLFPNQFVNVRLLVRTIPDAIVVPTTAVAVGAPGTYVYVIGPDNKVKMRVVKTGVAFDNLTQIVSGLRPGERVVTDGLDRLRDGREVKVVQAMVQSAGGAGKERARPDAHAKPAASGAR
ncbi:MAG: efflux RND transporter periplasmic adaptor subunit [Betaproteobacteria bacterium]|uniref:efflux RND transporter periplasmic adaptor subunit n=1 Tax=Thiomonas TaxID=32012 RepID=UPI0023837D50|nr:MULTISPECIES: efflux RND transporter periplasmic adaptor subunit [Thiomonas]MDE2267481.1 efflux RND transporter periplasmic adaptor subunit [Betaproteobacteria bacterium]HML80691.1 efflux RND transporter periplasmic adaptor subunit [Thiomonas arsenitoxydans]